MKPRDLRNPSRKSGYDHVKWSDGIKPFQARKEGPRRRSTGKGSVLLFLGPRRTTALEAAQDYCDYVNGGGVTPALPAYPKPTIDMGNITVHQEKRKGGRAPKLVEGPRDLYDVLFYDPFTNEVVRRKVGFTARGLSRYEGICRMMGLSMKPNAEPVTLPSESAARVAENELIAEICKDKKWQRSGKESFAPVGKVTA